ncbi:hypothetical protein DRN86_03975, partial [Candidatus Geothermarchaeota archaeon]
MRIIIIGAGPAGLSAAYFGLKSGNEVLVLERKRNYDKLCGEGVFKDVFDIVPLKPKPPIVS